MDPNERQHVVRTLLASFVGIIVLSILLKIGLPVLGPYFHSFSIEHPWVVISLFIILIPIIVILNALAYRNIASNPNLLKKATQKYGNKFQRQVASLANLSVWTILLTGIGFIIMGLSLLGGFGSDLNTFSYGIIFLGVIMTAIGAYWISSIKESAEIMRSRRAFLLFLTSPITALISVFTLGIILRKKLADFTTQQFIMACLFSLGLDGVLSVAVYVGFVWYLLLTYILLDVLLYLVRKAVKD